VEQYIHSVLIIASNIILQEARNVLLVEILKESIHFMVKLFPRFDLESCVGGTIHSLGVNDCFQLISQKAGNVLFVEIDKESIHFMVMLFRRFDLESCVGGTIHSLGVNYCF